jgi:hypothetical protein
VAQTKAFEGCVLIATGEITFSVTAFDVAAGATLPVMTHLYKYPSIAAETELTGRLNEVADEILLNVFPPSVLSCH